MPTGYKIAEQDQLYFLTLQVVGWVDLFTRKSYRDLLIQNLAFCQQNKALEIFAFVIMSNHIHLLVKSNTGNLSNTIRDFKSFTSKELLKLIKEHGESRREWMLEVFKNAASQHIRNSEYQLWTHENHAEHIYSNQFISQKIILNLGENAKQFLLRFSNTATNIASIFANLLSIGIITFMKIQWLLE